MSDGSKSGIGPARASIFGDRLRWRRAWTLRLVVIALLLAAVTYVAVANFVLVDLRLVGWRGDVRLSWVVLGAAGLGLVTGIVISRIGRWLV